MTLTKRKAYYIWYCISCHNGFVEDRGEWRENCDISEEELGAFIDLVSDAIEHIEAQ